MDAVKDAHIVYLGLGSNLGQKRRNVRKAIRMISELIGAVERQSALFVSKPWGFSSSHEFVNAVVRCTTSLSPRELLEAVQHIERQMGKTASSVKGADGRLLEGQTYHDRIIDIDILLYGDRTVDTPSLAIPHPRMGERAFVQDTLKFIKD